MILLFHSSGSRYFELLKEKLSKEDQENLFTNLRIILKTRGYSRALEFIDSIPFSVWEGTNDFNDDFSLLYAEIPFIQYEALRSISNYPDVNQAFNQLAEVMAEIGTHIRFIAVELKKSIYDQWDLFICHASEDKENIARPLSELLESYGLRVWLDDNELTLGDSLRNKIDKALSKSKYGLVILSKAFFKKDWPIRELNALASLESQKRKVILPIWHGIDKDYIIKYTPLLADKFAVNTNIGLTQVALQILHSIQPTLSHVMIKNSFVKEWSEQSTPERVESIKKIVLGETIAIKEKAQRYLEGKSNIEELSASTPMLTSIAPELRHLTPKQVIAYRRAVTLDMEMRKTGRNEKILEAIDACDEVIRLIS